MTTEIGLHKTSVRFVRVAFSGHVDLEVVPKDKQNELESKTRSGRILFMGAHPIKVHRTALSWRLIDLSAATGIPVVRLHRIETRKFRARESELKTLAKVLRAPIDTLR